MKHIYSVIFGVCVVLLMGCSVEQPRNPVAELKVGDMVPRLENLAYLQGPEISLGDANQDKVYLIEFWATWCPPCKKSAPILTGIQRKYKDRLVVVGISDEQEYEVKPYLRKNGASMDYSIALDLEGDVIRNYILGVGEDSIPLAFLVDSQGRLIWYGNPMNRELPLELERLIG